MTNYRKHQHGFTLMELMVSVTIVGLMAALVLVNTRTSDKNRSLVRSAQKLVLDIRKVQNLALSPTDTSCVYGFKIDNSTSTYKLYKKADCSLGYNYVSGAETETKSPENKAYFFGGANNADIAFAPPEPITYLNGTTTLASTTLTLVLPPSGTPKIDVIINRLGQIEIGNPYP